MPASAHLSSDEKLIHTFVTYDLDYCNSLLHGLPVKLLNKSQCVQNSSASLLTRTFSLERLTPPLARHPSAHPLYCFLHSNASLSVLKSTMHVLCIVKQALPHCSQSIPFMSIKSNLSFICQALINK